MKHPYQVLGTSIPTLLGRNELTRQIERHLLKPSPDHVSVVGPTMYGKSVLLQALAARHKQGSSYYVTSAYTDLRREPPTTDDEFRRRFAGVVKGALEEAGLEASTYIELTDENPHELLDLALDALEGDSQRLLVVLDGFDHVLAGTGLTRNLWDQLRSLAQKGSLRLVTGSRRPLRELCKSEESRTSDFWEIFFDTPIGVGAFDESDWDSLLGPFIQAEIPIEDSGRKELVNWTGGIPVLTAALLASVAEVVSKETHLTKEIVDSVAGAMLDERRVLLEALWEDCNVELRGDLALLAENEAQGVRAADLSDARRRNLDSRGHARAVGNRLRPSCRLMSRFAMQQAPTVFELQRLFENAEAYEVNIRGLLELRFAQVAVPGMDKDLRSYVEGAIRDLVPNPEMALKWMRSIATRALAIIWDKELGPDQKLPTPWLDEWKASGERLQWLEPNGRMPRRMGAQCNVLRLATGADRIRPMAAFVTKPTALLIDALQSVGDFGQHREDFPESQVTCGMAASAVLWAIELVSSLNGDLSRRAP